MTHSFDGVDFDSVDSSFFAGAVDVVDVDSVDGSFLAVLFTITTTNFFSSRLYDSTVRSSAKIKPETTPQQKT